MWQDKNITSARQAFIEGLSTGIKVPSGKGKRLIITHIRSEEGFLKEGLLTFESTRTGDYHEDMNSDVFEDYFGEMIKFLPANPANFRIWAQVKGFVARQTTTFKMKDLEIR